MMPDIACGYARQRFRQMLLDGTGYGLAQEWRHLFLKRSRPGWCLHGAVMSGQCKNFACIGMRSVSLRGLRSQ